MAVARGERVAQYAEVAESGELLQRVCALTDRFYNEGARVLLYVSDEAEATKLDSLLWTFKQNSFIPHARLEEATEPVIEPVLIVGDDPAGHEAEVLIIVTAAALPAWYAFCPRVCDFVPGWDESAKKAARQRFGACRDAGYRMLFAKAGE
jgi:DNA polymerase III subunit chi